MTESSWEAKRRSDRKIRITLLLIIAPLILLGTVLFINNREMIGGEKTLSSPGREFDTSTGNTPVEQRYAADSTDSVVPAVSDEYNSKKILPLDSVKEEKKESITNVESRPVQKKHIPPLSKKTSVQENFSELLPPFSYKIENRKDIVISLTLELFFNDPDTRMAIRLRRDDIKVMVSRVLWHCEIESIRNNDLERQLLNEVNSIFDVGEISNVAIKKIQVEKAVK